MSSQEKFKLISLTKNKENYSISSGSSESQTQTIESEEYNNFEEENSLIRNETFTTATTQTTAETSSSIINDNKLCSSKSDDNRKFLSTIEPSLLSTNVLDELEFNASIISADTNNSSSSSNNKKINILSRKKLKINYFNLNMILYYGRECLCILIFIFTTYATYQNIPPKISITPPRPFFSIGSIVHDWPAGQLGASQHRVSLSELALVMFYAPWCAESQYARSAYEYVARLYYREVHFAAINCWQPGGECRQQYTKVMSWPVLMAYTQNGLAIPYTGRWTNDALSRFVQSLLNPIYRITTPDELLQPMMNRDSVVVAFVDIKRNPLEYREFYRAAIKWLEKDPFQEITWAVVTGKSCENFGIEQNVPTVRIYLWNETLEYHNTTWTKNTINKWVMTKMHQVSAWITPPGIKSTSFAPYLRRGPAFVLFTPRNLQQDASDAYTMVRQLSLEYFNCPNHSNNYWIKEMSRNYISAERIRNHEQHLTLLHECGLAETKLSAKKAHQHQSTLQSCYDKTQTISVSFAAAGIVNSSKLPSDRYCGIGPQLESQRNDNGMTCAASSSNVYRREKCASPSIMTNNFMDENLLLPTSMLTTKYDNRSPENLLRIMRRKRCERMLFLPDQRENFVFFDQSDEQPNFDSISGLSCKLNQTLSFLVIDSVQYHTFAERLGINIFAETNKTVAVIIDHENESTFVQKAPITANTLTEFVYNFLHRKLPRHLKSRLQAIKKIAEKSTVKSMVSINEINSEQFVSNVLLSNKTIFVLFYSRQCALCSLMTQHLLYVRNLLNDELHSNIDFVRIDGDQNDLPWQYTMERYPSLIAFANNKAESRIYPFGLQLTTENVLGFVLANMKRPIRLHALTIVCKSIKKPWPFDECLSVLRREITECISFSLKQWRNIARRRDRLRVLRRLQSLQRLYLHLYRIDSYSCDFKALDVYVRNILNTWTIIV